MVALRLICILLSTTLWSLHASAMAKKSAPCPKIMGLLPSEFFLKNTPNTYSDRADISLRSLFDSIHFYDKPHLVRPITSKQDIEDAINGDPSKLIYRSSGMYPVSGFAINSALNIILLEPHTVIDAKTGFGIVAARVQQDGTVTYLDVLGGGKDWKEASVFNPAFLGDSNIARVEYGKDEIYDYHFYDLSTYKKELKSFSKAMAVKFTWLTSFGNNVYGGFIQTKTEYEYLIAQYDPVTESKRVFFRGQLTQSEANVLQNSLDTLKGVVTDDEVKIFNRSFEISAKSTENKIHFVKRAEVKHADDNPRVLNNDVLSSKVKMKLAKGETLLGIEGNLSTMWRVKNYLSNEFYQVSDGLVGSLANHPEYGLIYFKFGSNAIELTKRTERISDVTVIGDTIVGLSAQKDDGSLDLVIIPVK